MRILLVAPFLPDPEAQHGGGIYLATLAQALSRHADVGLAAMVRQEESARLRPGSGPWKWVGTVPFAERPAGRGRARHQMRMLWHWTHLPLVAAKHRHAGMPALLQRARTEFRPDIVFLELAQMAQYLPLLRGLPTVLTDHEAGCPANTSTGLGAWGDGRDRRLWRRYVRTFYPGASLVQAVTTEDAASLAAILGQDIAVRQPTFAVPERPVAPDKAPARALFLGDYCHQPNPEAATRLALEVLPRLQAAEPGIELWLAGPHPERLQALASLPGVRLLGYVPDLPALFAQVRLLLAPLFSGGGFRMKGLAALAHGLPVVTNALGARGCSAPSPARIIAEGPEALAAASLELLRSPACAADAGRAAFQWARTNLGGDTVALAQIEQARRLIRAATATGQP